MATSLIRRCRRCAFRSQGTDRSPSKIPEWLTGPRPRPALCTAMPPFSKTFQDRQTAWSTPLKFSTTAPHRLSRAARPPGPRGRGRDQMGRLVSTLLVVSYTRCQAPFTAAAHFVPPKLVPARWRNTSSPDGAAPPRPGRPLEAKMASHLALFPRPAAVRPQTAPAHSRNRALGG